MRDHLLRVLLVSGGAAVGSVLYGLLTDGVEVGRVLVTAVIVAIAAAGLLVALGRRG